jgi:hypothetical protein
VAGGQRGGDTPADQTRWNDFVYLSRDRFLDLEQDRYLGYREHVGMAHRRQRLCGPAGSQHVPADLAGAYYVFVVSDPARVWGSGERGQVREFGNEQNNAGAAPQPVLVETPPPADLKLEQVLLPAHATVGEEIRIEFTIVQRLDQRRPGPLDRRALPLGRQRYWDLGGSSSARSSTSAIWPAVTATPAR